MLEHHAECLLFMPHHDNVVMSFDEHSHCADWDMKHLIQMRIFPIYKASAGLD